MPYLTHPILATGLVHERERDLARELARREQAARALAASVMDRDVLPDYAADLPRRRPAVAPWRRVAAVLGRVRDARPDDRVCCA